MFEHQPERTPSSYPEDNSEKLSLVEELDVLFLQGNNVEAFRLIQQLKRDITRFNENRIPKKKESTAAQLQEIFNSTSRIRYNYLDSLSADELEELTSTWSEFLESYLSSGKDRSEIISILIDAKLHYVHTYNEQKPLSRREKVDQKKILELLDFIDFFLAAVLLDPRFDSSQVIKASKKVLSLEYSPLIVALNTYCLERELLDSILDEDTAKAQQSEKPRLESNSIDILKKLVNDDIALQQINQIQEKIQLGTASDLVIKLMAKGTEHKSLAKVVLTYFELVDSGNRQFWQKKDLTIEDDQFIDVLWIDVMQQLAEQASILQTERAFGRGQTVEITHNYLGNRPEITEFSIADSPIPHGHEQPKVFFLGDELLSFQQRKQLEQIVTAREKQIQRKRNTEDFLRDKLSKKFTIHGGPEDNIFTIQEPTEHNDEERQILSIKLDGTRIIVQGLLELDTRMVATGSSGKLEIDDYRFGPQLTMERSPFSFETEYKILLVGGQQVMLITDFDTPFSPDWDGMEILGSHLTGGLPESLVASHRDDIRLLAEFILDSFDEDSCKEAALVTIDQVTNNNQLTEQQKQQLIQTVISYYQLNYGRMLLDQSMLMVELVSDSDKADNQKQEKKKQTQVKKEADRKRMIIDLRRFISFITKNSSVFNKESQQGEFTELILDSSHQRNLIELFDEFEGDANALKRRLQDLVLEGANQLYEKHSDGIFDKVTLSLSGKLRKLVYGANPFRNAAWKLDSAFNRNIRHKLDDAIGYYDGTYESEVSFSSLHIDRIISMAESYWLQKRNAIENARQQKQKHKSAQKRVAMKNDQPEISEEGYVNNTRLEDQDS